MKIWVCVPTLWREAILPACVESIAQLEVPAGVQLSLVLVDNSTEQTAKPFYDSQAPSFPIPFTYLNQPQRGVSRARNLGIEHILAHGGDAILFVDDDMRLPPDYLTQSLAAMRRLRADAVRGRMVIVEDSGQTQKPRRARLFQRRDILATNGPLVAIRVFNELNLRFDERFMHGFEDYDLFYRAHVRGARLFLLEDCYFWEYRPPHRLKVPSQQKKLIITMITNACHVCLRKYRGGLLRASLYVVRRGVPLMLQITGRILTLPFTPTKSINRIQNYIYGLAGLVSGLSSFPIKLTPDESAVDTK